LVVRLYEFCLWQAERKGNGAIISARGDEGEPALVEQHLDYAELPFNIKLYQCEKVVMQQERIAIAPTIYLLKGDRYFCES
jgi:hypothetical protein